MLQSLFYLTTAPTCLYIYTHTHTHTHMHTYIHIYIIYIYTHTHTHTHTHIHKNIITMHGPMNVKFTASSCIFLWEISCSYRDLVSNCFPYTSTCECSWQITIFVFKLMSEGDKLFVFAWIDCTQLDNQFIQPGELWRTRFSCLGVKWPQHEDDLPFSANVKNDCS